MDGDDTTAKWIPQAESGDRERWEECPSTSRELPVNLLSGYKMQWALNRPLKLVSGRQFIYVNAYKLATQSLTFRRLIKEVDERQKRRRNRQDQQHRQREHSKEHPLLIDCHLSTDVNDLAFAIHFCHLGECRISTTTVIERSETLPTKRRDEKSKNKEDLRGTTNTVLLSTAQLHLTTTVAECNLTCGLRVANTYGMESLHKYCIAYLKTNLNLESCWTLWKIIFTAPNTSTNTNISQIDEKAGHVLIKFMHENFRKFTLRALSRGFAHFSASELEFLLASDRLNVRAESEVVDIIEAWISVQSKNSDALLKFTPRLIEHCVRLDQLEVDEINRLLKLPGMQMKRNHQATRTGNGVVRNSLVTIPDSSRNYESRNRCVWMLQQLRRRLLRTTRNLRSLSSRLGDQDSGRVKNWSTLGPRVPHEAIVVFGGWENGQPCRNVRVLDSRRKKWKTYNTELESSLVLPHPLMSFGIANVDNEVIYIAGGESRSGHATQEVLRYELKSNSSSRGWKGCAPMHDIRRDLILVNLKDKTLYAIGGDNNRTVLDSVEALALDKGKSNGWVEVARMIIPRGAPAGDAVGSLIYVCGGYTESRMESLTNSCETYNPETNQWTMIQPMTQPRYYASAVCYQNHLYILGGGGDNSARMTTSVVALGYSSTVERYTPEEGVWELMPSIAERADFAACVHEDKIFCIGGGGEAFCTADIEYWRPWVGRIQIGEERHSWRGERDNSEHPINESTPGPSSVNAPIWMPVSEGDDGITSLSPQLPVETFDSWHKGAQLPLPLWGHRCVSINGVDKVIPLLSGESNPDSSATVSNGTPKSVGPCRWKVKRSASNTILAIVDVHESMPQNEEKEKAEDGGEENGKIEVRVGKRTMLVEY
ncbi:Kelch-like protein 10 [Echinococcus granulosus]|uniref:Kelch-like protein 10 n=1 Tax=Echinococcus granulosus TaxID=6210 RepID=W6UMN1_ECHGR|nr:Kelch-like protein 10 [Echinococcus granulosus]EUB59392.1 Kelch-like protein 10 [Echinococcus granulosus]